MRAELRSLGSLYVEDLSSWIPDADEWAVGIQIVAGPVDGPGEETFNLTVCSVAWVALRVAQDGIFDGRHHLVLAGFRWDLVRSYIERRVKLCEGHSWKEVANCLGRLGYWEFEDYSG